MIVMFILVVGVLGMMLWQRTQGVKEARVRLNEQKENLSKLQQEIEQVKASIEQYKKEQEEFGKLLFDERDVPSFLDGISEFAKKTEVLINDMKTERFSEVEIPQAMSPAVKSARARIYEDFDEQASVDQKAKFKEMITLAAMPIRIKVSGPFEALGNFLNYLDNYRQLVSVSNVSMETTYLKYPRLDCEFTLKIYSLKRLNDIK